jgi:predicted RNA-binding protein with PIN domain
MHYLIDAYNLMFCSLKKKGTLRERRQLLIEELNETISQSNLHVTLVFDGAEDSFPHSGRGHFDHVELVYTPKGKTADEYITEEIASSRLPGHITVVTNDRELAGRCRNYRAKTLTPGVFLTLMTKKKEKKKKSQSVQPARSFQESSAEFKRLLLIFEKKLLAEENEQS